ncbi:MAG: prenyltransferase [Methanomassiliicoccales archaeon]
MDCTRLTPSILIRGLRLPLYWSSGGIILLSFFWAYHVHAETRIALWAIAAVALLLFEVGANLINEVHDSISHIQVTQRGGLIPTGPFLMLETGVGERQMAYSAGGAFLAAAAAGFYCAVESGYVVILSIGAAGLLLTVLYALPPFRLGERAIGEIVPFLSFGPLPMLALSYLISGRLSLMAILISISNAFWVTAIRYVHHINDVDTLLGEKHVKRMAARVTHATFNTTVLFSMAVAFLLFLIPYAGLLSLIPILLSSILTIFCVLSIGRASGDPVRISERTKYLVLLQFIGTVSASLVLI